jgi:Zn-dependent oligopeptidase
MGCMLFQEDKLERHESFNGTFGSWDWQYYHWKLLEKEHAIHEDEVREYFPLDAVTRGMHLRKTTCHISVVFYQSTIFFATFVF